MKKGQIDSAIRRAINIFDDWNEVTSQFEKHSGYYYEILGVIEDAVHCGIQEALGVHEKLDSEKLRSS